MDERLKRKLTLYIDERQDTPTAKCEVEYGIDFNTIEELKDIFCKLINNYLEDSGEFEVYLYDDELGKPSFIYNNGIIKEREEN